MCKDTIILYRYKLTENGIEKTIHSATVERSYGRIHYEIKVGKWKNPRWIKPEDIGKLNRNIIYSYEEHDDKYRQMMIEAYENIVEKRKRDLARDEALLKVLRGK